MADGLLKDIWKTVLKAAITPVVGALLAWIFPPVKEFFLWLWSFVVFGWHWLGNNHSWPGWLLVLLVSCGLLVIVATSIILFDLLKKKPPPSPDYLNFTKLQFRGAEWRWGWTPQGEITNLWCYCPTCDGTLVYLEPERHILDGYLDNAVRFYCENCGHREIAQVSAYTIYSAKEVIKREILRRVRTSQQST
ncbi:hypothetical protein [Chromobacterium violaceum]|uniref:hypothetical protein n=1 Tax=Chromobacterium violaceum TaxID=536 RepID=UPI001C8B9176|nr:hypothetical protein [Chromobacterium violaceum]MBX9268742.1 hypothetical protein [Chromobacterium violaceum]